MGKLRRWNKSRTIIVLAAVVPFVVYPMVYLQISTVAVAGLVCMAALWLASYAAIWWDAVRVREETGTRPRVWLYLVGGVLLTPWVSSTVYLIKHIPLSYGASQVREAIV